MQFKIARYFLVLGGIIAGRIFDIYETWKFTPDLTQEGNPIASAFGYHWAAIWLVQAVVIGYVAYCLRVYMYSGFSLLPATKYLKFSAFFAQAYFGRSHSPWAVLWKWPGVTIRLHFILGYILSVSLLWLGAITTIMWLLIFHTQSFYKDYYDPRILLALVVLMIISVGYYFFRKEYKRYLDMELSAAF